MSMQMILYALIGLCPLPIKSPKFDWVKRKKGGILASLYNCKSGEIMDDVFMLCVFSQYFSKNF